MPRLGLWSGNETLTEAISGLQFVRHEELLHEQLERSSAWRAVVALPTTVFSEEPVRIIENSSIIFEPTLLLEVSCRGIRDRKLLSEFRGIVTIESKPLALPKIGGQ